MKRSNQLFIILFTFIMMCGCSKGDSSPVAGDLSIPADKAGSLDSIPVIAYDGTTAIGMLGAYDLVISPDGMDAQLTPMRVTALGESYIVSGASFFTNAQCLKIKSIALDAGSRIHVVFKIKHPFAKGNPSKPPTAQNRLDLDLFDLAMSFTPGTSQL